ncbi:hypothetical protein WI38_00565 [Burkholderia ubonensis]|uniref:Uncharacterized protein n=1 Tax=Burkholderia ubonensis TaxID=101571 RepID=A0A102L4I3_9BURK|nr:hypothetical protein [Burkholderia ubonensis]KUZ76007.1 hypothetical protein WI35_07690 [Burkholderia ubonensis]KUZ85197.1 hypothetical protein WI39_01525 [Burkholderia ubonensis]KUZ86965.1 hypothetical protein WI38_00565 [Burkholderia ubonensis]
MDVSKQVLRRQIELSDHFLNFLYNALYFILARQFRLSLKCAYLGFQLQISSHPASFEFFNVFLEGRTIYTSADMRNTNTKFIGIDTFFEIKLVFLRG